MHEELSVSDKSQSGSNGNGNGSNGTSAANLDTAIRQHIATQVADHGAAETGYTHIPSVIVRSAEGVTVFGGVEDDHERRIGKWLDRQIEGFSGNQNEALEPSKAEATPTTDAPPPA
ncbi:hypothetical protein [Baekduia sp.]|uniref:hypothetical protein n=1 Tax=Baekduia sp. TaxID=2600305 RepID=UPI002E005C89|nr:hypothetical protein [Baekduia sp.]